MAYKISEKIKIKTEELLKVYPDKNAVLLPLLAEIQKETGFVSEEAMKSLSEHLGISFSKIKGVSSFYTMFKRKPAGKYRLELCRNISCHFAGSPNIINRLKEKLGVNEGETTKDGLFTLSAVECLGSCGTAPVMSVNGIYYENLTIEKAEKIIDDLKNGKNTSEK